MILGSILSKPNQSPYDTLVIDVWDNKGIKVGDIVFALSNVPIGRVGIVYNFSSKVVLFSSPGEKTQVVVPAGSSGTVEAGGDTRPNDRNLPVGQVFTEAVGRGGGNFEIILPRDIVLAKGAEVVLPGINSNVLGIVEAIVSDPRDSFTKILLTSPVNIFELKFVEVEQ